MNDVVWERGFSFSFHIYGVYASYDTKRVGNRL